MDEENILDSSFITSLKERLYSSVKWWEGRRFLYNLIIIFCEIIMMFLFWKSTQKFGIGKSIFWSVLYTIAANVFFSMGWGIEILVEYYFKESQWIEKYRDAFLVMGILFSIFITIVLYKQSLHFY